MIQILARRRADPVRTDPERRDPARARPGELAASGSRSLWFVGTSARSRSACSGASSASRRASRSSTALVEPVRTYLASRALGISPWRFAARSAGVVQATAIMAVTVLVARAALVEVGVTPAVRLVLLVALGAPVYLAAACGVLRRSRTRSGKRSPFAGSGRPPSRPQRLSSSQSAR